MNKDTPIFDQKSFADLAKHVFNNSSKKEKQITALINELQPLIKTIADAQMVVPLIKEYMEISVKNDEQLVKLTGIIQRMINASSKMSSERTGELISEEEKARLVKEFNDILVEDEKISNSLNKLPKKGK